MVKQRNWQDAEMVSRSLAAMRCLFACHPVKKNSVHGDGQWVEWDKCGGDLASVACIHQQAETVCADLSHITAPEPALHI